MTWTKLSDDFGDECWTLSDPAFRLLVEMLNYSNRKLLDLSIPKDELRRFAKNPDAITELVSGDWCADDDGHWLILFHGLYQPSKADVLRKREANRANGRRGGRPAISGREHAPITQSLSHSLTQSLSESLTQRDGTGILSVEVKKVGLTGNPIANPSANRPNIAVAKPSQYCSRHPVGTVGPCIPCRDARIRFEEWDQQRTARAERAALVPPHADERTGFCREPGHDEYPLPCDRCLQEAAS